MNALHYAITGYGPTVVLLPGMGLDMHIYDTAILLLQKSFTCVQIDNLGSGASPAPHGPYDIPQMTRAVGDVLAAEGLSADVLVGHSMSGFIALSLAQQHREHAPHIMLCGAFPSGEWLFRHRLPEVAAALASRRGTPDEIVRRNLSCSVSEDFLHHRSDEFALLVDDRLHHLGPGRGFSAQRAAVAQHRATPLPDDFAGRIWIVHGTADRLVIPAAAQEMSALLPSAEVKWLEGIGHLPMLEAPARLADLIKSLA
ncbi:MAG: alpha/beta hydrolase [Myxococcales bacterium]|jgi:pimeloyl-ACP methyl ester carboxylesterase|nr:alpha/beta hydrolase [Myxococcales bacterium]